MDLLRKFKNKYGKNKKAAVEKNNDEQIEYVKKETLAPENEMVEIKPHIAVAPTIQEVDSREKELDELIDQIRKVNRHWKIERARKKNVPMKALLHAAQLWLSDNPNDWAAANNVRILALSVRLDVENSMTHRRK